MLYPLSYTPFLCYVQLSISRKWQDWQVISGLGVKSDTLLVRLTSYKVKGSNR